MSRHIQGPPGQGAIQMAWLEGRLEWRHQPEGSHETLRSRMKWMMTRRRHRARMLLVPGTEFSKLLKGEAAHHGHTHLRTFCPKRDDLATTFPLE